LTDEAPGETVRNRRVYEWAPRAQPPLADLFGGPDKRRGWMNYWLWGKLQDGAYIVMHRLLGVLPIDLVSNFGAHLGWFLVRHFKPKTIDNAKRNFRRLRPQWSDAQIAAATERLYRHIGRVMTEFACLTRMADAERLHLIDPHVLTDAVRQGPVIIVSLHTGNWEAGASALNMLGLTWGDFYVPPPSETLHRIANEIRENFGIKMLPPGMAGVRPAIRMLKEGGCISIFCDEVHYDRVMGPFFGRPPHIDGNLAIAVRLARMTGARIVIGHTVRKQGCNFDVFFRATPALPQGSATPAELLADVAMLNAQIEPIVDAHIDQWYFLDNDF
jgi:KDO2-lipid IV(A) lauroyltransferase